MKGTWVGVPSPVGWSFVSFFNNRLSSGSLRAMWQNFRWKITGIVGELCPLVGW